MGVMFLVSVSTLVFSSFWPGVLAVRETSAAAEAFHLSCWLFFRLAWSECEWWKSSGGRGRDTIVGVACGLGRASDYWIFRTWTDTVWEFYRQVGSLPFYLLARPVPPISVIKQFFSSLKFFDRHLLFELHIYTYAYMHMIISEKGAMNLKESRKCI